MRHAITLMVLVGGLGLGILGLVGWAQETDFDSLMDDVAYPPPIPEGQTTRQAVPQQPRLPNSPPTPVKKKWWQLGNRQQPSRSSAAAAEEAIVNVGPREAAASNDLLFRLPLPVRINDQDLKPGFYLVKQPAKQSAGKRELLIYKENKRLALVVVSAKDAGEAKGPVKAIDPKHPSPPLLAVEAHVTEDQKSLTLVLKEGERRFISDPLMTQTDTRVELNF